MKPILWLALTWATVMPLSGQVLNRPALEEVLRPVIRDIYNLRHGAAEARLEELYANYPAEPAIPFLRALNQFWLAELSYNDERTHGYILAQLEEAIDKNQAFEGDPGSRESYHFIGFMSHALEARLWFMEEEDWSAVNAARKVLRHLDPLIELAEGSPELSLIAGLYHYYSVVYPRDKSYLKPFMAFFPDGDVDLGLQELSLAAEEENLGQAQALYYLTDIYLFEYENAPRAVEVSRKLHNIFPGNTWFYADYIEALLYDGRFDEADRACRELVSAFHQLPDNQTRVVHSLESHYTSQVMVRIYQYLGMIAYHHRMDAAEAKDWLWNSRRMIGLAGLERSAYAAKNSLYLGLCEDQLGHRAAAIEYYQEVRDHPDNRLVESEADSCLEAPCTGFLAW